jgi:hypothetical protein
MEKFQQVHFRTPKPQWFIFIAFALVWDSDTFTAIPDPNCLVFCVVNLLPKAGSLMTWLFLTLSYTPL